MQHHRHTRTSQWPAGGSSVGPRLSSSARALICGLLLAVAVTPAAVAQVFPDNPTQVFFDGFELYSHNQGQSWTTADPWWLWQQWESGSSWKAHPYIYTIEPDWADNTPYSMWGEQHLVTLYGSKTNSSLMVIRDSIPPSDPDDGAENPNPGSYNPDDWVNLRYELDVGWSQLGLTGLVWGLSSEIDTNFGPADRRPDDGYIFYIEPKNTSSGFPNSANCTNVTYFPSTWHLARIKGWDREGKISGQLDWVELASGDVIPKEPGTETPATVSTNSLECFKTLRAFRIRLDTFCGNIRVQYMMPWGNTPGVDTLYYGCASAAVPTGICSEANKDECWCEIFEGPLAGVDPTPLEDPGMVGLWHSNIGSFLNPSWDYKHDNVKISTFPGDCGLVCGPWSGWQHEATDIIPFKRLYEGALFDFSAGRHVTPAPDLGKIDVNTEAPASVSGYNHSADSNPYCNGWNLLEDLPAPTGTTNIEDIKAFLEPMTSAVKYESDGGFSWVDDFDNDPASPGFNPVPMVADGSTPINSSLLEAYDWYVAQRTTGSWSIDPYEGCRQWYVILITDGEEACEPGNPNAVCDPGGAAEKFANPDVVGVDPLPVYTIGFSEGVSDDSPLKCIADETGGLFLTAENASQLSDALYEVFYRLEGETRTFTPFKISPPPSGVGGNATRDYLVIYPFFQPQDKQTLWSGNLWAFPLNKEQPTLPTVGDCQIDTSKMAWNAYDALEAQLDAHTEGNPKRFVFMGSDAGGSWARHDLATIPTNSTLRDEFKVLIDVDPGDDVLAQQVVNFVRDIRVDNDTDPSNSGPPALARPSGYPVLGDTFHSQPVIVNPPNNSLYFFNYGYNVATERGAHDYRTFIEEQSKRRRIVLAGANDGMLHAFDGGFWDRDRAGTTETYDGIHDLGNGTELFAWVPRAVMDRLLLITAGGSLTNNEPLDMVDGPIVKGDAFIDAIGDSDREWRTVALASMRRGGRGIVALDITQPDPIGASPDYDPVVSQFPGCMDGSTAGCSGEYPRLMWEFSDTLDADLNGVDDLGWTWSKPAIARIAISQGTDPPDDVFVAFFGGGWDADNADQTGTYFYGVDLETGAVVVKHQIGVDLPGGVTALDSDSDGFHDRIYFADSDGGLWRIQYPSPTDVDATGAEAGAAGAGLPGEFTRIFDFRGFSDRQEIFTRPVPVPALFNGSSYTWALAFGSGDRAELDREDSGFDHFFFVLDVGDDASRTEADLLAIDYTDLNASFDCTTKGGSALDPAGGKYGWYLSLRETEKVVFDATVLNGRVFFPTFDPSTDTAVHGVPDQCGSGGGGGTPVELSVVCRASGIGRTYELWYECGLGDYREYNDIVTGMEVNNVDGSPEVEITGSGVGDGGSPVIDSYDPEFNRQHSVTNWRQE